MKTRLMVIEGCVVTAYEGKTEMSRWSTGDGAWPVDAQYIDQIVPIVYDQAWIDQMAAAGRKMPEMLRQ